MEFRFHLLPAGPARVPFFLPDDTRRSRRAPVILIVQVVCLGSKTSSTPPLKRIVIAALNTILS